MNRREFLKSLAAMAAVSTAPVYFDMGKNLWRRQEPEIVKVWWGNRTFSAAGDIHDGAVTAESFKKFMQKKLEQLEADWQNNLTLDLYLRQE